MSYNTSTQSNPFCQGGWKAATQREEKPSRRHLADLNATWPSDQPSTGSLPMAWPTSPQPRPKSTSTSFTTTVRFAPTSSRDRRFVDCAVIGPEDRVLYTVATSNANLTIFKDAERRPVALVEWASMPVIDIRGDKGKKRLDQWLVQDAMMPSVNLAKLCRIGFADPFSSRNMHLMVWKGVWYCWTIEGNNIFVRFSGSLSIPIQMLIKFKQLYAQAQLGVPLAVVRASGAMFEAEFTSQAMKAGLLEPSVVAVLLLQSQQHKLSGTRIFLTPIDPLHGN